MAATFGIIVLLLFTVSLNVFMRLRDRAPRPLPTALGVWQIEPTAAAGDTYVERRQLVMAGGFVRKTRIVEQRRTRRTADDAIVDVSPEITVDSFWG